MTAISSDAMAKRAAWNSRRTLNRTSWAIADSFQNGMYETCKGRDAVKKNEKIRTQWIWWWVRENKRVSDSIYVLCNLQEWSVIISINLDKQSDIPHVCFNNFISCSCRGHLFKYYCFFVLFSWKTIQNLYFKNWKRSNKILYKIYCVKY